MWIKNLAWRFRVSVIVLCTALVLTPLDARAHEDAVLRSTLSTVAAGDTLPLSGADFSPGVTYTLRLVGALREFELRDAQGGADGTFDMDVSIPRDVVAGVYKLVALAPDGDAVASLDLTIVEPVAAPSAAANAGGERQHAGSGQTARADEMPIERSRSGAEWGAIGLVIGLAAGLGVQMLRRP